MNLNIDSLLTAQIVKLKDVQNNNSPNIGLFQGINFKEGGFSGLYPIQGTNNKEYWVCSDRGVNVDCANANPSTCKPTYDKLFCFPYYAPKIHRIRIQNDAIEILQSITIKNPNNGNASGIINPTGLGSTASELASIDTVDNCNNFLLKTVPKDTFGIDPEGIVVDQNNNFWLCEEGGATIWKVNSNGVLITRYTPFANLNGKQNVDIQMDTVFKYRKNNRGFEGISITPNGKIYAIIQSPILYPTTSIGEASRIHRIIEIDPNTNSQRMFAYVNDGIIGTGGNSIRNRDWKIGDMVAVNDSTFLVIEAALRGTTDIKRIYLININQATPVHSGLYSGSTLEGLVDSIGLANQGIKAVSKKLFMDLLANGWPSSLEKAEGLSILNDSTIALCNDNDFGQVCPNADGIPIATNVKSHLIIYGLYGSNKLLNFTAPPSPKLSFGITGPNSTQSPYVQSKIAGSNVTSILTAGDKANNDYKMVGIPDGMGAFDNGDGTFTLLVNHEIAGGQSIVRSHGANGAFISKWIINKSDLSVLSGSDLIQRLNLWTDKGYKLLESNDTSSLKSISRLCSADLPKSSAFYNELTGLGTEEKIFLSGEESGSEGRAFAHVVTGNSAGTSFELPDLGKFSWENAVACPFVQDNTIVIGMDDSTPGQVYVYLGKKTNSGSVVDKAGLTNGKLFGIVVENLLTEMSSSLPDPNTKFSLIDLGMVRDSSGSALNSKSNKLGVTSFLRPEDGTWDPNNPKIFYFVTTNSFTGPSRLWKLEFNDIQNPLLGGKITALLDGTEGQKMLDNITIDNSGHILLLEDVGSNVHLGKIWQYSLETDQLIHIAEHDSTRFIMNGANFITQDEEASGIIDAQKILGQGQFLLVDQAHKSLSSEIYEGGQILSLFNIDTYNSNPKIKIRGNGNDIINKNLLPNKLNNTSFDITPVGFYTSKNYEIQNFGNSKLVISSIGIGGPDRKDFVVDPSLKLPIEIAPASSQTVSVQFYPTSTGTKNAIIHCYNNDLEADNFYFAIRGDVSTAVVDLDSNVINIKIHPNPVLESALLEIFLTHSASGDLVITDVQGNAVLKYSSLNFNSGENSLEIPCKNLPNGIYFAQFKTLSKLSSLKFVVRH